MYLFDSTQSLTRAKYFGSKIFSGRLVLGKKITPPRGKIGRILGNLNFIVI
tara:strand:- start:85 stop:237 length:153 start_codon:yes stop_codon:yes gene_type:complete